MKPIEQEKYMIYFDTMVNEDREEVVNAGETASQLIKKMFNIPIDPPELYVSIWSKVFEAFVEKLYALERKFSEFEINVAGRFRIGYTTTDNETDEKTGSFMIYIEHIGTKPLDTSYDPMMKSSERIVQWNMENIIDNSKIINEISILAIKKLKEMDVQIGNPEFILPIFTIMYEVLVDRVQKKRQESGEFEYEINCIWFFMGAREGKDLKDDIYIRPTITSKLAIKNDAVATPEE